MEPHAFIYDKIYKKCLLLSLAVHAIAIIGIMPFNFFPALKERQKPKEIEVTYYNKAVQKRTSAISPPALLGAEDKITAPALTQKQRPGIAKPVFKEKTKILEKIHKTKIPATEKVRVIEEAITKDKWRVFHEAKDLSGQPAYLKYRNLVRSKIELAANANKPYVFRVGEINLIFTILDSGDLKNVDIVDNGKGVDPVLMRCALDSVYAASPFPPFPADIKEDHLTIQVPISFEK